jgi:DNA-binding HxlR family transcriptional regulator
MIETTRLSFCKLRRYLQRMQRKSFRAMMCPIARTLDRVGEWWTMLILRDAFQGLTRFEQFQVSLDIAPNILTRRLNALVKAGLLEKRPYSRRPLRHEYVLTQSGQDFWPVLVMLAAYGNRHFAEKAIATRLVDIKTGKAIEAVVADKANGRILDHAHAGFGAGPAADASLKLRISYAQARRQGRDGAGEWKAYAAVRSKAKARRG